MKTLIKILLLTAVIAITSVSTSISAEYKGFGAGGKSCGAWTSEKANSPASSYQNQQWVLGFVSGAGWSENRSYEADADGMLGWIDNYCKENPLKDIGDTAAALIYELEK
jgi:hypothetical protein